MKILSIKKCKGKKRNYCIGTDNSKSIEISENTLGKFGLRCGDELSDEDINKIINAEEELKAKNIAINYLSYRPRSAKEVYEHLIRKGIDQKCAKDVIINLQRLNLIDDKKFAYSYVKDKLKKKPIGNSLLIQQLNAKGIQKEIINSVLSELVTDKTQELAAIKAVQKKILTSKYRNTEAEKRRKQLFDFLLRRGFSIEIAKNVTNKITR